MKTPCFPLRARARFVSAGLSALCLAALFPALACAASAPAAQARGIAPGLWRWTFSESTPIGNKDFKVERCVKAGQQPRVVLPGPASACHDNEHATPTASGDVDYTFSCQQATGPITSTSNGSFLMHVAHDGHSASLKGNIVTQISGAVSRRIQTTINGDGHYAGTCPASGAGS